MNSESLTADGRERVVPTGVEGNEEVRHASNDDEGGD